LEKAFKITAYTHKCRILDLKKKKKKALSIRQKQYGLENRRKHNIVGK